LGVGDGSGDRAVESLSPSREGEEGHGAEHERHDCRPHGEAGRMSHPGFSFWLFAFRAWCLDKTPSLEMPNGKARALGVATRPRQIKGLWISRL
jgi:hypothetical protein